MGSDDFPPNSSVKMLLTSKRGQESGRNRLEPIQSSAKQCLEVVCGHFDARGAVRHHFLHDFRGFSRFWEPGPAKLPSRLSAGFSKIFRGFPEDFIDFGRIFLRICWFWKDFRDLRGFSDCWQAWSVLIQPAGKPGARQI